MGRARAEHYFTLVDQSQDALYSDPDIASHSLEEGVVKT